MAECNVCGARVSPGEHFCGNCGTQLAPSATELRTLAATLGDEVAVQPEVQPVEVAEAHEPSGDLETAVVESQSTGEAPAPISSNSLGGSFTDSIPGATSTPKQGTTGGHRPTVKQLAANTVLNGRYEIVRRIGGGGMGAVYLAKDRNLGDAPRAVKEMVESHLDPAQHEKAI